MKVYFETAFRGFFGGYQSSGKEPDLCLLPKQHRHFVMDVAIETGCSESWPVLHAHSMMLYGGPRGYRSEGMVSGIYITP